MANIKTYQEQVQEVVGKAIDAVEGQYKALAGASFGYAEKYYNVETVKTKHDEVVALATGKARDVNKVVGSFASDLIAKFDKAEAPKKAAPKTAAKKPAAKKAAAKKAPAKKAAATA